VFKLYEGGTYRHGASGYNGSALCSSDATKLDNADSRLASSHVVGAEGRSCFVKKSKQNVPHTTFPFFNEVTVKVTASVICCWYTCACNEIETIVFLQQAFVNCDQVQVSVCCFTSL